MINKYLLLPFFFVFLLSCSNDNQQNTETTEVSPEKRRTQLNTVLGTEKLKELRSITYSYEARIGDSTTEAKVTTNIYGTISDIIPTSDTATINDTAKAEFWPHIISAPYAIALTEREWNNGGEQYLKGVPYNTYNVDIDKEPVPGDDMTIFLEQENSLLYSITQLDTLDKIVDMNGGQFAVTFEDYDTLRNVVVPKELALWAYSQGQGTTEQVGTVSVHDFRFTGSARSGTVIKSDSEVEAGAAPSGEDQAAEPEGGEAENTGTENDSL